MLTQRQTLSVNKALWTRSKTERQLKECSHVTESRPSPKFLSILLPAATKLGQGNIFTSVCLSTGGGVCLSACWDTHPPRGRHPPRTRHPLGSQTPPRREQTPLGSRLQHTVNERPVRILLECILVLCWENRSLVQMNLQLTYLSR